MGLNFLKKPERPPFPYEKREELISIAYDKLYADIHNEIDRQQESVAFVDVQIQRHSAAYESFTPTEKKGWDKFFQEMRDEISVTLHAMASQARTNTATKRGTKTKKDTWYEELVAEAKPFGINAGMVASQLQHVKTLWDDFDKWNDADKKCVISGFIEATHRPLEWEYSAHLTNTLAWYEKVRGCSGAYAREQWGDFRVPAQLFDVSSFNNFVARATDEYASRANDPERPVWVDPPALLCTAGEIGDNAARVAESNPDHSAQSSRVESLPGASNPGWVDVAKPAREDTTAATNRYSREEIANNPIQTLEQAQDVLQFHFHAMADLAKITAVYQRKKAEIQRDLKQWEETSLRCLKIFRWANPPKKGKTLVTLFGNLCHRDHARSIAMDTVKDPDQSIYRGWISKQFKNPKLKELFKIEQVTTYVWDKDAVKKWLQSEYLDKDIPMPEEMLQFMKYKPREEDVFCISPSLDTVLDDVSKGRVYGEEV